MNKVYLLLGGNQGKTASILASALNLLEEHTGKIAQSSPLYETAAWGKTDQPNFLNQAVELHTAQSAETLLRSIQRIESLLGRQRTEHWGQRTLDIDILFFNDAIIQTDKLLVPHPEIANRRFALVPLCAITPDLMHPVFHLSVQTMLDNCRDSLPVILYAP